MGVDHWTATVGEGHWSIPNTDGAPLDRCAAVGCGAPRYHDEERGTVRRWCWNHSQKWDAEARRQGGADVIQLPLPGFEEDA